MESQTASSYPPAPAGLTAHKKVVPLFQPGTLLVAEYLDEPHRGTLVEPEKRLMLAVLAEAINGFQENHSARYGNKKKRFDEVQRWIFESQGDWIFAFENICSALELNPEYIRQGLLRWKTKRSSNRPSIPLWEGATAAVIRKPVQQSVSASSALQRPAHQEALV
jgi:hypothetical protein